MPPPAAPGWRGETPQAGEAGDYGRLADTTERLIDDGVPADMTPLARARALLEDSSAARSGIEDLLSAVPVLPPSD